MFAGADIQLINPDIKTHLAGAAFGEYRPCESVLDDLYAKAVVIESNNTMYALISLDVTIINKEYCDIIRKGAAEALGISEDAVLVFCTQTHSAPGVGCFMFEKQLLELTPETEHLSGTTKKYSDFAASMAIKAAVNAKNSMKNAYMRVGRSFADKIAFNRRMITRDGNMVMPGFWNGELGNGNYLCYEGPTDPEVCVVSFIDEKMNNIAMLMHFTCHPVNVFNAARSYNSVSSDWCGAWSDEARRLYPGCVPMVLNGACGNINPWDPLNPDYSPDHYKMGRALMGVTRKIINQSHILGDTELRFETRKIPLEYREIPRERLEYVKKTVTGNKPKFLDDRQNQADADWFYALSTMSAIKCREDSPSFIYEIHALRIGNTAVVGLPGEPFSEGQMELKKRSAAEYLLVAHCASQYVGYIAPKAAYAYDSHETNFQCTYWAKLKPGSLEVIIDTAKEMTNKLFG